MDLCIGEMLIKCISFPVPNSIKSSSIPSLSYKASVKKTITVLKFET